MALTQEQKNYILQGGALNTSDPILQQEYANFVKTNQAGNITAASLTPTIPPIIPEPKIDAANYTAPVDHGQAAIAAGNQTTPSSNVSDADLQAAIKSNSEPIAAPASIESAYNAVYQNPDYQAQQQATLAKQSKVRAAQAELAGIQAQIQGVISKRDANNLKLEQQASAGQVTGTILGRQQQESNRQAAIEALPLQALALAKQAEVAGLQGEAEYAQSALKMAQDKLDTAFQLKQKDIENVYNAAKENRKANYDFLTDEQKRRAEAKQKEDDRNFKNQEANLNDIHTAAQTLMASGQGTLAAKIWQLNEKSPTFKQDFATLISQAKPTTAVGLKETKLGVDLTGLPENFSNAVQQGKIGNDLLNSLKPTDKATLQSLLDYQKNPANLSLRKSAGETQSEREKFLSMAHLIDPSYDESQYPARSAIKKDFNSGKSAQNIRSLNTAVGHLDTLAKAGEKLENAPIPLWNKIANAGLTAIGDSRVVAFNTAATAVESELASVFKGMGATDQEIKTWRDNINSSQSPAQIKGAIDTAIQLMGSRLQALTNQYEIGIGKPKDFRILSDKSRQILSGLGVDVEALDPVKPSQEIGNINSVLKSPDGTQQVKISDLTPAQIQEAKQAGWK